MSGQTMTAKNKEMYKKLLFIFLIISVFVVADYSESKAQTDFISESVFYYQPASTVYGLEAIWTNPAALGRYKTASYQFLIDYDDDKFAQSWGTAFNRSSLGLAFRSLDNSFGDDIHEYIFAVGIPTQKFADIGLSYRYIKEGPDGFDGKDFWNVSLTGQYQRNFRWAAVFNNLNKEEIAGVKQDIAMRYSLGFRPNNIKLTLAVDMLLSSSTKIRNADYIYHAEFSPSDGLYLNGYIDNNSNFQLGFRVNLVKYFFSNKSNFSKNADHLNSTLIIGATSNDQPSVISPQKKRLLINLPNSISENPNQYLFQKERISFLDILLQIYRASDDANINSMLLKLDRPSLGLAQAEELRSALSYFQSSGKKIVCYLKNPSNLTYYIASSADKIVIPPVSQFRLTGLRMELSYYGATLDKIGVKLDMMRIGAYKTATERYTEKEATEENREQVNRILDNIYDNFTTDIAENRKISSDSLRHLIDMGPLTSKEAYDYNLVDTLLYEDEISSLYGSKEGQFKKSPMVSIQNYQNDTLIVDRWYELPTIGVIVADGEVSEKRSGLMPFSGKTDVTPSLMQLACRQIGRDIEDVVLRVNSPGGDALAGDKIYHSFDKKLNRKNTVVSFGNIAASGGYYFSMADTNKSHIFVNKSSLTGSIGIFGGKADLSGFYDKLEVGKELYQRGKYSAMMSNMRPFTEEERRKYMDHLRAMYDHFLELVSDARGLDIDSVDNLGQGKVWMGSEAISNGLADEVGGFKAALDKIASEKNYDDYRVEFYPKKRKIFQIPGLSLFGSVKNLLTKNSGAINSVEELILPESPFYLMRMPFDLSFQ